MFPVLNDYCCLWQVSVCSSYLLPVFILTSSQKDSFPKPLCVHNLGMWLNLVWKGFEVWRKNTWRTPRRLPWGTVYEVCALRWLLEDVMNFFQEKHWASCPHFLMQRQHSSTSFWAIQILHKEQSVPSYAALWLYLLCFKCTCLLGWLQLVVFFWSLLLS